jgi:ankyrin repeat protein
MIFLNFSSCKVKDQNGLSCIHFCANNSHLRVSKFLLKKDKNFVYEASQSGCRPIHLAARKGNYALLELLLKIDKKIVNAVDMKRRTPLHYASGKFFDLNSLAYGNVASIRILIEYGADVNFKDDDGVTSLHYATMSNYLDCVQMLVKGGAIVEIDDNSGRSALIWAFMQGI